MTTFSVLTKRADSDQAVRAGFAIAIAMLIAIAAFAYRSIEVLEQSAEVIDRTHGVQADVAEIDALYARARLRWRFYISNGDPAAKANAVLNRMTREEERLLTIRERENRQQSAIARLVIIGGTTASIAILLLALFLLSRQMQRLKSAEQNITALNSQLQKRMEHLVTANNELESFSYSVSHDLRTPLRAIGGYARMLEEDQGPRLDDDGKRFIAVVCKEANRMGLLIDDLLTFSRLGREQMKVAEVDMDTLVRDVIQELRPTAKAATRIDVQPLPAALGDRALLRQVWINLAGNAIKYAGERDEPGIWISGGIEGDAAVYSIKDNGAGFDMRHYNKLFGVFQRLHTIDDFPGTGIGLAIVHRVIMRHGGRVWAESEPDRGAVFKFSLPIEVANHG